METRIFNSRAQLRSLANGDMRLGGYAAKYNLPSKPIASRNGGSFVERLSPGAFNNVLHSDSLDCVALVNHDMNKVLGRTPKTLRLESDNVGLYFQVDLSPDISHHRDLYEAVKRGDMNGCSFAFIADDDEWDDDGGAYPVRTVRSVKALRDISIVTDPAYSGTEVGIRSDVDLCEVRSSIARRAGQTPLKWVWEESPEYHAWRQRCADVVVLKRRISFINELLS